MNEQELNNPEAIKAYIKQCYEFNKSDVAMYQNGFGTLADFVKGRYEQTKMMCEHLGIPTD